MLIIITMAISQIQIKSVEHLLSRRQEIAYNSPLPVGLPDAAAYYYLKEASFLSKKQQRWIFYFFQGLNTNPQNLSIYLRDQAQRENKNSKQKLVKGVFTVWDLFGRYEVVIEINIPGNLRIFKLVGGKKELVSNEEMDLMYLSSMFRGMYQINLPWGRSYLLFHDSKNYLQDLRTFFSITFRSLLKRDINIGPEFEAGARVKGSHACSLIFNYLRDRRLVRQAIQLIDELLKRNEQFKKCPKYKILLAELYVQFGKTSRSLQQVQELTQSSPKDAYLTYYQGRYLYESGLCEQALAVVNSIVHYNQFQIWFLLGQIHLELKNLGLVLICLNHAVKMAKIKGIKHNDNVYKSFEELGKVRYNGSLQGLQYNPKLLVYTDSPLSIMVREVQEKNKFMIERGYWKLNANEKIIYNMVQDVRYRLESKKFEELLMNTFEDNVPKYEVVHLKKVMTEVASEAVAHRLVETNMRGKEESDDLPQFLKESAEQVQESVGVKPSRNLSIIQQIESVIENSNYQQREKEKGVHSVRLKHEVCEGLFRMMQLVLAQGDFQKAEYQNNVAKILQIYNKMRPTSKFNNYYADRMFNLFMQTTNYKSIVVLVAQTLNVLQEKGVRRLNILPYWMHKYVFFIIEEKGLKFLSQLLQKMNYYDQAIVDAIQIAKSWKMKGVTY